MKPRDYILFDEVPSPDRKTRVLHVHNDTGETLGRIEWYPHWRRYVFLPEPQCIFDRSCLIPIGNKLAELMLDWRNRREGKIVLDKARKK